MRRRLATLLTAVLATSVVVAPGEASAAGPSAPLPAAVDVALQGGTATATSAADGHPARLVIDGDAGTTWCADGWRDTVTVDLGRARSLSGLGITLGASAVTATIDIATTPGVWRTVPSAARVAIAPETPSYFTAASRARFARLTVSTGDGTNACVGAFRTYAQTVDSADMMHGADLSFQAQELAAGTHYTDAGRAGTPMQILRAHGGNYVRLRLWVDPPDGYSDLDTDLALARAAHDAGLKVYLDLHYSDFWADPQHERTPAAWRGQHLAQLARTVRTYTSSVLGAFADQGTPVDMVSIGNEIRNGLLWPIGRIDWEADTGWAALGTLLRAGVAGAHDTNPQSHSMRVMLHFDQGGDYADSAKFFGTLIRRGVDFDTIGLSYYPFWHGTPTDLRDNVDGLAQRFDKDVVVAETQYAWTLANGDDEGNFVWQAQQLSAGYPASPGGQLSFESDVQSILAAVPGGHGLGVFYWEPEWVPGLGWKPGAGAPNDNLTLFDFQGRTLPSIGIYEDPVAVCARSDPSGGTCTLPS